MFLTRREQELLQRDAAFDKLKELQQKKQELFDIKSKLDELTRLSNGMGDLSGLKQDEVQTQKEETQSLDGSIITEGALMTAGYQDNQEEEEVDDMTAEFEMLALAKLAQYSFYSW